MRTILLAAGFALALAPAAQAWVPAGPLAHAVPERAQSDVFQVKKDKYKYEYKWKGGGCKYQFKANHKGVKEKYKCK